MRLHREAFRRLDEIAEAQQGFFTAKQAKAAGFSGGTHPYHVRAGNWVRKHRGIYRLAFLPPAKDPDLVLCELWSSNREGRVEGVYSHETALSLHGFSDLNPARLHMTVPRNFRRSSRTPGILRLHYADDLPKLDLVSAPGYKFTGPLRTILDLAAADTMPRNVLGRALLQMIRRKMILREDVREARMPAESRKQFEELLRRTAGR